MPAEGVRLACRTPGHCLLWDSSLLVFINLFVFANSCFSPFLVVLQSGSHRSSKTPVSDYLIALIAFSSFCVKHCNCSTSDSLNKINYLGTYAILLTVQQINT